MDLDEKSIVNNEEYLIRTYNKMDSTNLLEFFKMCLPESGRNFEPGRAHASLLHVEKNYCVYLYKKQVNKFLRRL